MKSPSLFNERWAFLLMIGSAFRVVGNYCFSATGNVIRELSLFLQLAVHEVADQ